MQYGSLQSQSRIYMDFRDKVTSQKNFVYSVGASGYTSELLNPYSVSCTSLECTYKKV
jgi:hypothetical protein